MIPYISISFFLIRKWMECNKIKPLGSYEMRFGVKPLRSSRGYKRKFKLNVGHELRIGIELYENTHNDCLLGSLDKSDCKVSSFVLSIVTFLRVADI